MECDLYSHGLEFSISRYVYVKFGKVYQNLNTLNINVVTGLFLFLYGAPYHVIGKKGKTIIWRGYVLPVECKCHITPPFPLTEVLMHQQLY